MSGGPDVELQGAIVAELKADTTLRTLIGNPVRLHQVVPKEPTFPYVTIGESQNVPDLAGCINGSEIFVTLHVFSRTEPDQGYAEAKRIIAALDNVLHDADLTLAENRCVLIERDGSRVFTDADNSTRHGVVSYRALVEPTV